MRQKLRNRVTLTVAFFMLCLTLLPLLGGCTNNNSDNRIVGTISGGRTGSDSIAGMVFCDTTQLSKYPDVVARILPANTVEISNSRQFEDVYHGAIVEAFDPHAVSGLQTGAVKHWYPQYLATAVIAIDRDLTNEKIESWSDLAVTNEKVGISSPLNAAGRVDNQMMVSAISFGLEGEGYTLKRATNLLAALQSEKRLVVNSFDAPVIICFDYQAAALIKDGRNLEIIVPSEGTLTFQKGLFSNTELVFSGDVNAILLDAGLRLIDGRCDPSLYPDAAAYENASFISDYDHLNSVVFDITRTMRRDVFHVRLYTSADGREHQYWVFVYIIILVLWIASLINRISDKNMRKAVLIAGILILCWMLTRLISYQLMVNTDLRRYVGYTYFLYQLSLPVVLIWLANIIGKNGEKITTPLWIKAFAAYMFALIVLVYTNDLHGFVYIYDFSNPNWGNEYSYGALYDIVNYSWQLALVASFVISYIKGRKSIRKKNIVFPVFFLVLLAAYQYGYENHIQIARESDRTMVICVLILLFTESLIRTGLLPVNTKYRKIFLHSTLGLRVVDNFRNTAMSSNTAVQVDSNTLDRILESYPQPVRHSENDLLFAAPIIGGNAIWQEDISSVNRLHKEIEESVRKLKAANDILAENEKIKRAAQDESEKTLLMSQLEAEINRHMIRLSTMIEQLESMSDQSKAVARITLLLCYVKRRCNLFFREKESSMLPADELMVYFDELAEMAGYSGINTIVTNELKEHQPVRRSTLLYDFFYNIVYWATWLDSPRMFVHLGIENGNVVLRILPSEDARSFRMEKGFEKAIIAASGTYAVKDLDDDMVGISLSFPERGESNG